MAYKKIGAFTMILPYLLGIITGIGIIMAGIGLLTHFVSESGTYDSLNAGIVLTAFLAGLAGSIAAALAARENKLTASMVTGAIIIIVLFAVGIFGYDGLKSGIWKSVLSVFAGTLVSCWIAQKGKGKNRVKKMRYR